MQTRSFLVAIYSAAMKRRISLLVRLYQTQRSVLRQDSNMTVFAHADDYRFTAALNILKMVVEASSGFPIGTSVTVLGPPPSLPSSSCHSSTTPSTPVKTPHHTSLSCPTTPTSCIRPPVPEEALLLAIRSCEVFLSTANHDDIDGSQFELVSDT